MNRPMNRVFILLIPIFILLVSSYTHAGVVEYVTSIFSHDLDDRQESLREAINEYEKSKEKTGKEFNDGLEYFKQALANAKQKNLEFKKVHDRWEVVEKQVNDLQDKFKNQIEKADLLFKEFYSKANEINDNTKRENVISKIDKNFSKFKSAYKGTKDRLDSLWVLHSKVNDNIVSLEIIYSLNEIQNYISNLKNIEIEVTDIMNELDELSKTTSTLVDLKFK